MRIGLRWHLLHHILRRGSHLATLVHALRHWLRLGHGHIALRIRVLTSSILLRHHSLLSSSVVGFSHPVVIVLSFLVILIRLHLLIVVHSTILVSVLLSTLRVVLLNYVAVKFFDLSDIFLLLFLVKLVLGHPEFNSNWSVSEDRLIVKLLDSHLSFFNLLEQNVSILIGRNLHILNLLSRFLNVHGDNVSTLSEFFLDFLLSSVAWDKLNIDVRIKSLGQILLDGPNFGVVRVRDQLILSLSKVSVHYQELTVLKYFFVHFLESSLSVLRILKADISVVFPLTVLRDIDRFDLSEFIKQLSQVFFV